MCDVSLTQHVISNCSALSTRVLRRKSFIIDLFYMGQRESLLPAELKKHDFKQNTYKMLTRYIYIYKHLSLHRFESTSHSNVLKNA